MIEINDDTPITTPNNLPGLIPRDYQEVPLGSMPYCVPFSAEFPIIPEAEWPARIEAMQGKQIRYLYTGTPAEDYQNGLPYCWTFSLSQDIKATRDRDVLPHVDLLAESMGGSVNWRSSGNYCGAAIKWAAERGMCDRSFSPTRYNLRPSTWRSGWEQEALNHRVTEFWELGKINMRQEVCTALLLGFSVYVGLNWAGHAMSFQELLLKNGKYSIWTPNTHGDGQDWLLTGSKMIPDEAYVVRTTTWSPL
jgi:hypothetical protein